MEKDIEQLVDLIMRTGQIIRKQIKNRQGENFPLTHTQVLLFISENHLPSMKDIAHFLGITPPSATAIINTLVTAKLIKRVFDPKDRRSIHLALTPVGKKNLTLAMRKTKNHLGQIFTVLGSKERKSLFIILKKLKNNI